jgi:hypothetical protein
MTHYEPIKNDAGKIVGILFVGYDLDAFEAAMDRMAASAKFFQHGGTYIVAMPKDPAKAQLAAHPSAKGKLLASIAPDFGKRLAEQTESTVVLDDVPDVLGNGLADNFAVARKSEKTGLARRGPGRRPRDAVVLLGRAGAHRHRPGFRPDVDDAPLGRCTVGLAATRGRRNCRWRPEPAGQQRPQRRDRRVDAGHGGHAPAPGPDHRHGAQPRSPVATST